MPAARPRLLAVLLPACGRQGVLVAASSGSIDLLQWFTELEGILGTLSLSEGMTKYTNQQPGKEKHRAGSQTKELLS